MWAYFKSGPNFHLMTGDGNGVSFFAKRKTWKLDFNTIAEISWQFSRKADWNLFAQYYNGYGEGLLDYNRFSYHLRAGIVIRPKLFSNY